MELGYLVVLVAAFLAIAAAAGYALTRLFAEPGDPVNPPVADTADLRSGAPINESLLAILPLVGVWSGAGRGIRPDGTPFTYQQRISFVHDGRPFLAYESRSWLVDADGELVKLAWRESGFWRMGAEPDQLEVMLAANTGEVLLYGGIAGELRWDITTTLAAHAPTAKQVDAERRLYAVTGTTLVYATELAPAGQPLAPHLNASLQRA